MKKHISPRVAALGADAFEQGPIMIKKVHAYLLKEVNLAENAEEKTAEFVNRICQITHSKIYLFKQTHKEQFNYLKLNQHTDITYRNTNSLYIIMQTYTQLNKRTFGVHATIVVSIKYLVKNS